MKATCSEIQNTDSQLFTTFDTFLTLVVKLFLSWIIQVKQNYKKKAGVCIISFSCTKYVLPHFFSLRDYLGRQHIIEAPSIKATKDVHISLKGGEKLLKLSIPVWWNSSEIAQGMDFTSFWKISRSYEKDWPKWWSLGVQKLRFISWKHRDDLTSDS